MAFAAAVVIVVSVDIQEPPSLVSRWSSGALSAGERCGSLPGEGNGECEPGQGAGAFEVMHRSLRRRCYPAASRLFPGRNAALSGSGTRL
ncbi:hypothetical protein AQJ27_18365 [Streptomyces olivochromogenes]|nr:hypothetical protein AQJ27_18365 [Streptomyces olivochromogenes]